MSSPTSPSPSAQTEAGSVSLSMAGGCRMRIWLKGHGFQPEPPTPSAQRTFDYGDAIEWLLFDTLRIPSSHEESGFAEIGGWWKKTEVLREPSSGLTFNPSIVEVKDRQLEVEVGGFKGHIDGWGEIIINDSANVPDVDGGFPTLIDAKSANGFSYDSAAFADLEKDVFKREYVITQNTYMEGLRKKGIAAWRALLVFVNKETGPMMFRLLGYNGELVAEGIERLNWANSKAEPEPDHKWEKGGEIPLRCRYCEQKVNCSLVRAMPISPVEYDKRNKPHWRVL